MTSSQGPVAGIPVAGLPGAGVPVAELTTLRVGGPARRFVEAATDDDLIAVVTEADDAGEPVLVLGGGSNVVVSDDGFDGVVVRVTTRGLSADPSTGSTDVADPSCGGVIVTVAAGESWDDVVARAVAEQWIGIEALSGIPGAVGATPMQNVGAYGQEVADTLWSVRTWDRQDRRIRTFAPAECGLGYRTSVFKGSSRYLILGVTFQFRQGDLGSPVKYAELAARLGVEVGARVPAADVRTAVLELRRGKAMVLDASDHDTWSAGSFFTNPVLSAEAAATLPDDAPRYLMPDGTVKSSAAWLIDRAGFAKGHPGPGGRVSLSGKHTLAITNRGSASAADVLALAREVRDGVRATFGVSLVNEPVLVGLSL